MRNEQRAGEIGQSFLVSDEIGQFEKVIDESEILLREHLLNVRVLARLSRT